MIIGICFFTQQGEKLAEKLMQTWVDPIWQAYSGDLPLKEWTGECFRKRLPILFVGACGIAVRSIAPFVRDKMQDSPILVIDEKGKYVIPVLSGHMGGANLLARQVSIVLGAQAVITTATDVEGMFSVDVFAREQGFQIKNRERIKVISSKLLRGQTVTVAVDPGIELIKQHLPEGLKRVPYESETPDLRIAVAETAGMEQTLLLTAKKYVLGMGCKKGKTYEELADFLSSHCPFDPEKEVFAIATIDIKKREEGLWTLAQYHHLPLLFYSAEVLRKAEGEFEGSQFVQEVTGVDNVCERAALCAAGPGGKMLQGKTAEKGMTLAIAERRVVITSWTEEKGMQ